MELEDFAVGEGDATVGKGSQLGVVGYDDKGLPVLVAQVEEKLMELAGVGGIEVARGLVGEDHAGMVDQRSRHSHPLLLATGELGGLVMGTVIHLEELEEAQRLVVGVLLRAPPDEGGEGGIFQSGELGQEIVGLEDKAYVLVAELRESGIGELRHIDPLDDDGARIGPVEGAEDLQEGGLARTGSAHDGDHLALSHLKGDLA